MRKRRSLSICFSLMFLLFFLSPSAIAHGGKTDPNGGHYDSSTGDYHYHHGYPAHAHFDMNNDGILDCPYDYDDQTDHSSRTSTSSDTYAQGKKDGYTEGYADGYKKGDADGFGEGLDIGKSIITSEYEGKLLTQEREYEKKLEQAEQDYSNTLWNIKFYYAVSIALIFLCFIMFHRSRLKKKRKAWKAEQDTRINELIAVHEKKEKLLSAQIKQLRWHSFFDSIAGGKDPSLKLPTSVYFKQTYTPIKGKITAEKPFGEYTVFMTQSGKKYHCHPSCSPSAKPVHFFDICRTGEPCRNCVPKDMHPQPHPDWYIQIRERLNAEYEKISKDK